MKRLKIVLLNNNHNQQRKPICENPCVSVVKETILQTDQIYLLKKKFHNPTALGIEPESTSCKCKILIVGESPTRCNRVRLVYENRISPGNAQRFYRSIPFSQQYRTGANSRVNTNQITQLANTTLNQAANGIGLGILPNLSGNPATATAVGLFCDFFSKSQIFFQKLRSNLHFLYPLQYERK